MEVLRENINDIRGPRVMKLIISKLLGGHVLRAFVRRSYTVTISYVQSSGGETDCGCFVLFAASLKLKLNFSISDVYVKRLGN